MSEIMKPEGYTEKLIFAAQQEAFPHAVIIEDTSCEKALENVLFLAKFMLCDSKDKKPCEKCGNCIKMSSGSHTDVKILKPEKAFSSIKIEEIRKIREDAHIVSLEGGNKFYIIENAELMTPEAQNAFIKILEEPPRNVIFILICNSISKLLPTVRSRCQIYSGENDFDTAQGNTEISELAESIVKSTFSGDVESIMRLVSGAPNDRNYLEHLTEMILHKSIRYSVDAGSPNKLSQDMINELHGLIKIFENNININLLKCRIMAALIE